MTISQNRNEAIGQRFRTAPNKGRRKRIRRPITIQRIPQRKNGPNFRSSSRQLKRKSWPSQNKQHLKPRAQIIVPKVITKKYNLLAGLSEEEEYGN